MSTVVALQKLLEQMAPKPLILISDDTQLTEIAQEAIAWHANGATAWQQIDSAPRATLAVIDAAAAIPAEHAPLIAGRLRDFYAERVVVISSVDQNCSLNRKVLVGLGFHQIGHSEDRDGKRVWFEFDIASYKTTPDWLNPRHWANPMLWDKYRW